MLIIKKNLFDVIRCFHKTNDEGGSKNEEN